MRFREGVGAGAGVVVLGAGAGAVSWLSTRLRRAVALVGCWYRCRRFQLAMRTVETGYRCWCQLVARAGCTLTLYSLVPSRRMSTIVGFCLAIWVYAGVMYLDKRFRSVLDVFPRLPSVSLQIETCLASAMRQRLSGLLRKNHASWRGTQRRKH